MAGKLVETKSGKGKTDNSTKPVNEKVVVILDEGEKKILCNPKDIKVIGFWD